LGTRPEALVPAAGAKALKVADTEGFVLGQTILIEPGTKIQEANVIVGFGSLRLKSPLQFDHAVGAIVVLPRLGVAGAAAKHTDEWKFDSAMLQKCALISSAVALSFFVVCCFALLLRRAGCSGQQRTRQLLVGSEADGKDFYKQEEESEEEEEEDDDDEEVPLLSERSARIQVQAQQDVTTGITFGIEIAEMPTGPALPSMTF